MISKTKPQNFPRAIAVAGCFIHNSDQYILLLKRKKDQIWGLPGGKLEHGESPIRAMMREVREETGIVLSETRIEPLHTYYVRPPTTGQNFIYHSFISPYRGALITLSPDEHTEYGWWDGNTDDSRMTQRMYGTDIAMLDFSIAIEQLLNR